MSGRARQAIPLQVVDEAAVTAAVTAERQRLRDEAGVTIGPIAHFRRPRERSFTRAEREHVTILFGGLTTRHEQLVYAALEGLGYRVGIVPTPRKTDFQAGKEYGNNGQCNPTYFTVGALVNYLKDLRDRQGLSRERILNDYVFITAGACGPCRFGMYEAEYRLALENSGFSGFRVLLFQQGGGLNQAEVEAGIDLNLSFFLSLLNALFMADLLNEVAYQIRPYETVPGRTNDVLARCVTLCQDRLQLTSRFHVEALEVAKSIYYCNRRLAHMVLSLKPFGCMPSTQSDGAHAAVMAHFPDLLFLPIETSGEGDINAHSRVQMALGEAKSKVRTEFRAAVETTGYSLEEIRTYVATHRELRRPLLHIPSQDGIVGRAAAFCLHVGSLMQRDADWTGTRGTRATQVTA